MKRRDFFKKFGVVAATVAVAPAIVKAVVEEKPRQGYAIDLETGEVTPLGPIKPQPDLTNNHTNWGSIYDMEIDPKIWQEWHNRDKEGFQLVDWLHMTSKGTIT